MRFTTTQHVVPFLLAGSIAAAPALAGDAPVSASISMMAGVEGGSASTAPAPKSAVAGNDAAPPAATAPHALPNAAQLVQLLAPVAVFPDNLVAEVLAAATYPDQVAEADAWLAPRRNLGAQALQQALDRETWNDGVKALVEFPEVLHQMASNPQWTTALGEAYVNDPVDVMNAVQSLRQKAVASGNLTSNKYLSVTSAPNDMARVPADATPDPDDPAIYEGPALVAPPAAIIQIAPSDPDTVYVPYYDPAVVYGDPIGLWPGYAYAWPAPLYYGSAFGLFAFGAGIGIDVGFGHSWGWHAWHTRWGAGYYGHGWRGPTVVHDNRPFVDHSNRIVNHFDPRDVPGRSRNVPPRAPAAFAGTGARGGSVAPRGSGLVEPARIAAPEGGRVAPADFNRMTMPHFENAMAEPRAAVAGHAATAGGPAEAGRNAALASTRAASPVSAARDDNRATDGYERDVDARRRSAPIAARGQPYQRRSQPREFVQRPMPSQAMVAPRSGGEIERGGRSDVARPAGGGAVRGVGGGVAPRVSGNGGHR